MAAGTGVVVVVFFHVVVVVVVLLLLLLVVVASLPLAGRQAGSQAGRLLPFFLLFPIIDKTETAQYRDAAPSR